MTYVCIRLSRSAIPVISASIRERCAFIVHRRNFTVLNIFEEIVHVVIRSLSGRVLGVDSLHVSTGAETPLTGSEISIIRGLRKVAVGGV